MLACVLSCAILGLDGAVVHTEVDVTNGLPSFIVVGLPDTAVQESRERVQAAVKNAGLSFPHRRVTVNLAPASLRKEGPAYDLPIALGVLAASGQVPLAGLEGAMVVGELSLDGSVRHVRGVLPMVALARREAIPRMYVPAVDSREAALVPQVIDVAAFTVQNAFEVNYQTAPGETVVLVNVGAAISNINIVKDKISMFTRDVTIGGNAFTEEVQKQLNVSHDEAEAYKVGGTLDEHGVVPQEVERIMESVAEVMAGEFQRSLDFFLATSAEANVTKIYMAGGSAKIGALHRAIEKRSRLPVEILDAWRRVQPDPKLDPAFLRAHAPEALVALGLALRAPGDK